MNSIHASPGAALLRRNAALLAAAGALLALGACQTTQTASTAQTESRPAAKTTGRSGEAVKYVSSNMDFFRDAFAGRLNDDTVTLTGRLHLPEGDGPFPVVVWQHGSGPPYSSTIVGFRGDLRRALAAGGIGLFIADSYSGRGLGSSAKDQSSLSGASRVTDALRALEALAAHPRVDGKRIGITGTSWGGAVTVRTSHEPYAAAVLPDGPRYAAHVPFYASCSSRFERYEPTGAPLLFLLGEADDYTWARFCKEQAGEMRQAGAEVGVVSYPGAHHLFISSGPVRRYADIWHFNDCGRSVLGSDGETRTPAGGSSEGLSWSQLIRKAVKSGCARRGVTMGRNEAAARDSLTRTVAFFAAHLKKGPTS